MKIPQRTQNISKQDIESVLEVLQSDFLTQGNQVPLFEESLCDYTGAEYAVAVNTGTAALHLACLAAGLSENDWLWTSPISFVASANVALYCGAKVDFIDIDPLTNNIDVNLLRKKLELAKIENKLPKIIIPVHFAGVSCEMEKIKDLSNLYGFTIIEDACHALGGLYRNSKIGSCSYSEMTTFSFHPVKSITTGEGGAVMTNSSSLAEKIRLLRTHGITRDRNLTSKEPDGKWYYEQITLGYNYRMTDIQAALGCSQLKRLDSFIEKRNAIAKDYSISLADLPLGLPIIPNDCYSAFHLFVVKLDIDSLNKSREEIFNDLLKCGIGVNVHYIPIHLQPFYKKKGFAVGDFPKAEKYYQEAITLPIFVDLTEKELSFVIKSLRSIIN